MLRRFAVSAAASTWSHCVAALVASSQPIAASFARASSASAKSPPPSPPKAPRDLFADDGSDPLDPARAMMDAGQESIVYPTSQEGKSSASGGDGAAAEQPFVATRQTMTNLGVDPMNADLRQAEHEAAGASSVRLEVQATVMQSQIDNTEKRLADLFAAMQKLPRIATEEQSGNVRSSGGDDAGSSNPELVQIQRTAAVLAAQWINTVLNLASLLESEDGHMEEVHALLSKAKERLYVNMDRADARERAEKEDADVNSFIRFALDRSGEARKQAGNSDGEFLSKYPAPGEDRPIPYAQSICIGVMTRLIRAKLELGKFQEAVDLCVEVNCLLLWFAPTYHLAPDVSLDYVWSEASMLRSRYCRGPWLRVGKLHAMAFEGLGRPLVEQRILGHTIRENLLLDGGVLFQPVEGVDPATSGVILIDATDPEQRDDAVAYLELLLRYTDLLGLADDGKSWRKPDDPIFQRKRRLLNIAVHALAPLLSPTHPLVMQARAALALDCGAAVTAQESCTVLSALIDDASAEVAAADEAEQEQMEQEQALRKKRSNAKTPKSGGGGGDDDKAASSSISVEKEDEEFAAMKKQQQRLNKLQDDIFAKKHAVLVWKRKLGIVLGQHLQDLPSSLRLLEDTSRDADRLLGAQHTDAILTLRCWQKAAYFARDKALYDKITAELQKREAPPSI